jgi:hypothetical protein
MASKQNIFECLFTLLEIISGSSTPSSSSVSSAPPPSESSQVHIDVGGGAAAADNLQDLQQHVWSLLQLIPTNPVQKHRYESDPAAVDWPEELMVVGGRAVAATAADTDIDQQRLSAFNDQPAYALQVIEELLNPRQPLRRDECGAGSNSNTFTAEEKNEEKSEEPFDVESAAAWRNMFVRSTGFASVVDLVQRQLSTAVGDSAPGVGAHGSRVNESRHCLHQDGQREYSAVAVGLRVLRCCLIEALSMHTKAAAADTPSSAAPVSPTALFKLLIQAAVYAHSLSYEAQTRADAACSEEEGDGAGGGTTATGVAVDPALEYMVLVALGCVEDLVEFCPEVLAPLAELAAAESNEGKSLKITVPTTVRRTVTTATIQYRNTCTASTCTHTHVLTTLIRLKRRISVCVRHLAAKP